MESAIQEVPVFPVESLGYSPFSHLARAIGGYKRDNLFAMFTCYFDEAGGEDDGFIVVCGFVASVLQWEQFEVDWKLLLAHYDVPYLHIKEYAHFKGPFAKWKDEPGTRAGFLRDAASVIRQIVRCGFACRVRYGDFETVDSEYALRENQRSPYALAGRFCIARANVWMKEQGRSLHDIHYVFEAGGPDAGGLTDVTQQANLQIPSFHPSRDTANQAGMVQLQAADYLAYEFRKATVTHADPYTTPDKFRKSFQALFGLPVDQGNYGIEELRELCRNGGIPLR